MTSALRLGRVFHKRSHYKKSTEGEDFHRFIRFRKNSLRAFCARLRNIRWVDRGLQQALPPAKNVTADEQVLPNKARCGLNQFIGNKQVKIKRERILARVGADAKYICNVFPHLEEAGHVRTISLRKSTRSSAQSEPFFEFRKIRSNGQFLQVAPTSRKIVNEETSLAGTIDKVDVNFKK